MLIKPKIPVASNERYKHSLDCSCAGYEYVSPTSRQGRQAQVDRIEYNGGGGGRAGERERERERERGREREREVEGRGRHIVPPIHPFRGAQSASRV